MDIRKQADKETDNNIFEHPNRKYLKATQWLAFSIQSKPTHSLKAQWKLKVLMKS